MNDKDIEALLEASKISDSQDKAAFGMFLKLVLMYQSSMGISDEKLARFTTVISDFIGLCKDEKRK